jgi:methylthioribose-1-phosphate isomerase
MKIDGRQWRSVWAEPDGRAIGVIDQTCLPHRFATVRLEDAAAAGHAIRSMLIRGAPLIGAVAGYGLALALREDSSDAALDAAHATLLATRPTAVNLRWALDDVRAAVGHLPPAERAAAAWARAGAIAEEDVEINRTIGEHGLDLIGRHRQAEGPVNILTHCNAGWLATVDWGTALSPIYQAHDAGIPVHVWVDETRPRNQGAALTAWELGCHGVPHTVIADNAGGHLMRLGKVDLCIVGTDRVAANGDVCNKIGTYLKALAAHDNGVPFHVALPSPTIDWTLTSGDATPIEQRDGDEQRWVWGRSETGEIARVAVVPDGSAVGNWAFDVTPARLVTSLITERGVVPATAEGLAGLFPDRAAA